MYFSKCIKIHIAEIIYILKISLFYAYFLFVASSKLYYQLSIHYLSNALFYLFYYISLALLALVLISTLRFWSFRILYYINTGNEMRITIFSIFNGNSLMFLYFFIFRIRYFWFRFNGHYYILMRQVACEYT